MTHFLVLKQHLQNLRENSFMPVRCQSITDRLNITSPRDPVENKLEQIVAETQSGT